MSMMKLKKSFRGFFVDTDAATAVEYAVMLALILGTMIVGLTSAGGGVSAWWSDIDTELDNNGF